ncbi:MULTISPECIES: hypothetical protein [Carboxydothermus]|uniref:Com family DNA-binding transcriptional regulator n=1 Tax=Carboxydothermus ferrireducens DSM 11255 TaxID=1119529 RepID=A0ABX2R8L4_9THEO|nr:MULTISPECIES: hypothetical protein [Carboxydothermus]NYE57260.1 hypothetical protein [Carboxydothermus ferrireducens DSM 11255]
MVDLRCNCGKIVCQVEGSMIIIKCRHCKQYVYLYFDGAKIRRVNPGRQFSQNLIPPSSPEAFSPEASV